MIPAAKHFDPVLGIDTHLVQPPGPVPPVPVPHPYVGFVFDPFDYLPVVGATIHVNGLPRATAGTLSRAVPCHFPIGGTFVPPLPANAGEMFMGSSTVSFDDQPATYGMLPVLTCQSIGTPPPTRPRTRTTGKLKSLVLPTSAVLPVPAGAPVLIGGAPTVSLVGLATGAALNGLGKGIKRLAGGKPVRRALQKGAGSVQRAAGALMDRAGVSRASRTRNRVHRALCTLTGHPVDVATGKVLTDAVDFSLPGLVPLVWERVWYSTSTHRGPLGHGWHWSLDLALWEEEDAVLVRLSDGRHAAFGRPTDGAPSWSAEERMHLHREAKGYRLETEDGLTYHFARTRLPGLRRFRIQPVDAEDCATNESGLRLLSLDPLSLVAVRDRNDNRISLEREDGALVGITDSAGRRLEVVSDRLGRITRVIAPHPSGAGEPVPLVEYGYDEAGDLVEARDAAGVPFRYGYTGHLLTRETDRGGTTFHFAWDGTDESARCTRTWGDGGLYARDLRYDVEARETRVTDSRGATTLYEWNALGLVVRTVDAAGAERLTEWDEHGRKWSETDPLGGATRYAYDERGRLVSVCDPAGGEQHFRYDEQGVLSTYRGAAGAAWATETDERGNVCLVRDPDGNESRTEVDERGNPTRVTDALGRERVLEWDLAGNLVRVTDPTGAETRLSYDGWGRLVRRVDAEGGVTTLAWDHAGRITTATDAAGRVSRFEHDAAGNLVRATDPLARIRRYAYGAMGVLTAIRDPNGATTRYRYDAEGDLLGVQDAMDRRWSFRRDALGRVVEERDFTGRTLTYAYDAAGRLAASTSARGATTRLDRDAAGRLTRRVHADGTEERFSYDPAGRLARAENAAATVEWRYDSLGRVVSESLNGMTVESRYDAVGNRVGRVSPFGRAVGFAYDPADRLQAVSDPAGDLLRFERDRLGRERQRMLPSGLVSERVYSRTGELLTQRTLRGAATLLERRYRYDAANRLRAVDDARWGTVSFEHDAADRLTSALYPERALERYLFDEAGNVPAAPVEEPTPRRIPLLRGGSAAPERVLERVVHAEGWILTYDADRNLVRKEREGSVSVYRYDAAGRLEAVATAGGGTVSFSYDPLGRRVGKSSEEGAVAFLWDGDMPLGEVSAVGERTEYLFEPGSFTPMAMWREGGGAVLIETDRIGTPRAAFSAGGEVVWEAEVAAWGDVGRTRRGSGAATTEIAFRFPGQYADRETGLFYNRFRYYDPELRAYTQADPIGLAGGLQPSNYAPSPTGWVDPYGLSRTCGTGGTAIAPYWPPDRGALGKTERRFRLPGDEIDRYGYEGGTFVSPRGVPYGMRALPPGTDTTKRYTAYRVLKPIEVETARVAPWFDEPGLGIQHELPVSVSKLRNRRFLERISS